MTIGAGARSRPTRAHLGAAILGATLVTVACVWAWATLSAVGNIPVHVRSTTAAEAPNAAHAQGTVIGQPDGSVSVLPRLTALLVRLGIAGLLAALGAGLATWGLLGIRRVASDRRRAVPPERLRGDGREED